MMFEVSKKEINGEDKSDNLTQTEELEKSGKRELKYKERKQNIEERKNMEKS